MIKQIDLERGIESFYKLAQKKVFFQQPKKLEADSNQPGNMPVVCFIKFGDNRKIFVAFVEKVLQNIHLF